MVGFDLAEGRDVVDDAVNPHSFYVGNMVALNLVRDVVIVSFIHLLLSQDFCLEFLLVAIGQPLHFLC